jgi:hypothetical protein
VVDSEGNAFILHIEIQNNNQITMPDRMLRYLTDIRLNYPGEDVYQYLLYIGHERLTMSDGIQSPQLQYRYTVIDMRSMDYRYFLAQNSPDATILALLCEISDADIKTVTHEIIVKLKTLLNNDSKSMREYITMSGD